MSNVTFIRKFTVRLFLGLAVLHAPAWVLAEDGGNTSTEGSTSDDPANPPPNRPGHGGWRGQHGGNETGEGGGGLDGASMAELKSAVNTILNNVDVQSCAANAGTLASLVNSSTPQ